MPEVTQLETLSREQLLELKAQIDQVLMAKFYPVPDEDFL